MLNFFSKVAKIIFTRFVSLEAEMSIIINGIRTITGRKSSSQRMVLQRDVSNLLNQNIDDIVELTKNASKKQLSLLGVLAENFNRFNFYRKPAERDNSKIINEIFNKIKKPNEKHRYLCANFSDSLNDLNSIVSWAGSDKKRLNFVIRLNEDLFRHERPAGNTLIPDLVNSPHAEEYMNQYDKVRGFLNSNKNNPDAISILDKKFVDGSIGTQDFSQVAEMYPLLEKAVVDGENCLKLLNPQNKKLAKILSEVYSYSGNVMNNGNEHAVANILKSTNKKNAPLREKVLHVFELIIQRSFISNSGKDENLKLLEKLYNILDGDKNANKFVKKSLPKLYESVTMKELVDILQNVSTKKLNIFKNNAWNIILKTSGQDRIDALNNNITDAFFETQATRVRRKLEEKYGYVKKRSLFNVFYTKAKNAVNKLKDALTPDQKSQKTKPLEQKVETPIVKQEVKEVKVAPALMTDNELTVSKEKVEKLNKKQILKENVVSFVKTKLGKKTFASQQEGFSKNATQIRMSFLPEIFASIADTRKIDRIVGKRRSNSANKDALILYSKINGNNKKFVNYMLKKRNADNTRMFEIRDIIAILDKAETKIAKDKKLNSEYRAKDAKAYYNHLFDAKIEQYGKLKRTKN